MSFRPFYLMTDDDRENEEERKAECNLFVK